MRKTRLLPLAFVTAALALTLGAISARAQSVEGFYKGRQIVRDDADRKALDFLLAREIIGRPFVAPPSLPEDRARALRDAFMKAVRDPEFLRDAERSKMDIDPVSGQEVDAPVESGGRLAAAGDREGQNSS